MKSGNSGFGALIVLLGSLILSISSYGQPVTAFSADASACLQQNIRINNLSTGAVGYEWDFCADDILQLKTSDIPAVSTAIQGGYGFKLIEDNGLWFGFAISQANNSIIRLDFDVSPESTPVVTNLGNPGNALSSPMGIDVLKVGSNWFGFVAFANADYGFVRLDFGSSLQNIPTATNVGMFGLTGRMADVKLVRSQIGEHFLVTVNRDANTLSRINFGSSFLNTVSAANVFESTPIPGAQLLLGLDVILTGSTWRAMLADYSGNSIIQLNLGASLNTASYTKENSYTFPEFSNPFRVRLIQEGISYRAFVANNGSNVTAVDLKDASLSPQVVTQSLPFMIGLGAARWKGRTILAGVNFSDQKVTRAVFEQICNANISFANTVVPPAVFYHQSGNKIVELKATDAAGLSSTAAVSLPVSGLTSPDISFSYLNNCAQNPITFTSQNGSGTILSYGWDFGDTQTSSSTNPSHSFSSAGNYDAALIVTGTNACKNFTHQIIPVYNPPVADFQLPSVSIVCTNQNYLFSNLSSYDPASNVQWEWRENGSLVSTQKNVNITFNASVPQEIRLKASIPGCSNEIIKNINAVAVGPSVDFTTADNCVNAAVSFVNTTSGAVLGYQWDFGDGVTSTQINPSHIYSSPSIKQVTLIASNAAGCDNFATMPVQIFSKPVPDFSIGLPPFACSNTATPFQNNTPALTDSNIATWAWQFGDPVGGTSSQQNPSYVYSAGANYNVILTAFSDKGCTGTFTKNISIASSPVADFTTSPSCLNLGTIFTDLSSGSVQTRSWQIATASFSAPNPVYTFTSAGDFSATLTVTGANSCSTFKTKTIHVPVSPVLDFGTSNLCSGKLTHFTDITPSPQDAIVGWNWNFAGNSATGNPADHIFPSAGSQNVKMTTTHLSGCKYTLSKNILINTSPVADFIATPDRGSAPLIVQFTNTSQLASSYAWKFYDKVLSSTTQVSPSYTFTSLGDYSAELTATSTQGCVDVKTVPIIVLVPAIDLALTGFTLTPDPTTGKLKGVVTILNNSNISLVSAEIGLILADKAVVNETFAINLNPGQSVSKTLSFTISPDQFEFNFLCAQINSEKDVEQSNNKRCVNLEKVDYFFNPYPNPTSGSLHVDWISIVPATAHIIIYDAMGRKSYEWETLSAAGLNQSELDVAFLSAGLYFLSIETPGSKKTTRFFRQ